MGKKLSGRVLTEEASKRLAGVAYVRGRKDGQRDLIEFAHGEVHPLCVEKFEALKTLIVERATHGTACGVFVGNIGDPCDCWKREALALLT